VSTRILPPGFVPLCLPTKTERPPSGEVWLHDCETLEVRKATLATVLVRVGHGIWFNDHVEGDGSTVFHHACNLGLEGIVSKRKDSPYRSGRSPDWLKMKNAAHPAVKREEEEDWGR
jgi:ATP-dependent DNA ligase